MISYQIEPKVLHSHALHPHLLDPPVPGRAGGRVRGATQSPDLYLDLSLSLSLSLSLYIYIYIYIICICINLLICLVVQDLNAYVKNWGSAKCANAKPFQYSEKLLRTRV